MLTNLGSEVNSEGKNGWEIDRETQNSSKFYQIIRGITWNRENAKKCRTAIYKVHVLKQMVHTGFKGLRD
jgi:hypothetical protein